MDSTKRGLSEQEAAELWARAARLQDEERRRAEDTARDAGRTEAPGGLATDALPYEVAKQAAVESGIDERFIDSASFLLAVEPHLDHDPKAARSAKALGYSEETITERLIVPADLARVSVAVNEVTAGETFRSDPVEIVEPDGSRRALIYEVPVKIENMLTSDSFSYQVRSSAEVKRYAVLIRQIDDARCEVAVHCTLDRSLRVNGIVLRAIQAVIGASGAGVGAAVAAGIFGEGLGLGVTGLSIAIALTATGLGLGGFVGMGAIIRRAYRKAGENLHAWFRKLLTAVRMRCE